MKETKVIIIDKSEEEKEQAVDRMLSVYITEKCRYCGHEYDSVQDIRKRKVVYAGPYMLACKECFDKNNPS